MPINRGARGIAIEIEIDDRVAVNLVSPIVWFWRHWLASNNVQRLQEMQREEETRSLVQLNRTFEHNNRQLINKDAA